MAVHNFFFQALKITNEKIIVSSSVITNKIYSTILFVITEEKTNIFLDS